MNRGSEWRIWDLHVHTPASITHNYKARLNQDVWESYIEDLEHLPSEIKVLGINDYLFIDGYRKILEYKQQGRLKNIDLILPVIEFRLAKFAGNSKFKRINFHVIFSNEINPDVIEHQFLNALSRNYKLSSDCQSLEWGGVITKENLENLGQQIIAQVPEEKRHEYDAPIKEGFNNLNLEYTSIIDVLESAPQYFKGKYLTAIGKSEWDDLKWDGNTIADKKDIINRCSFVFSASESVNAYNKSKQSLVKANVNSLLLDCSDAHTNLDSDYKDKLGNCRTWIKADTTFKGLQQILYEPNERVCVSDVYPIQKKSYSVIDHIVLGDKNDSTWNQTVFLNPNLNTIIGGRSTGKSNLLSCIALNLNFSEKSDNNLDYINSLKDSVKVVWKDNEVNNERKIDYLQQNYIYSLVDDEKELNKLLFKILLSDQALAGNHVMYQAKCNDLKLETSNLLNHLLEQKRLLKAKEQEIRSLGDSKGIENEINSLKEQKDGIEKQCALDPAILKSYEEDNNRVQDYSKRIDELAREMESLERISVSVFIVESQSVSYDGIREQTKSEIKNTISDLINRSNIAVRNKIVSLKTKIEEQSNSFIQQRNNIVSSDTYKKGKSLYDTNNVLSNIRKRLNEQEQLLAKVNGKKDEYRVLSADYQEVLRQLLAVYSTYLTYTREIASKLHIEHDDVKLCSSTVVVDKLKAVLADSLNMKYKEMGDLVDKLLLAYQSKSEEQLKSVLEAIVYKAMCGELKFKGSADEASFLTSLLTNNFFQSVINVEYDGDSLQMMSPGKRTFVILKLLLDFSKNENPVLIDQPEDNLDNRAIYKELVMYLRKKKLERQIILVTHNPNIVVGADAENVIVANQDGVKTPNIGGIKFQYKNGSLEDSFRISDENKPLLDTMGIREHVCEILEGGEEAFRKRESKYGFARI